MDGHYYFQDAFAKGEIVLGTTAEGYKVTSGFLGKPPPSGFAFEIHTPERMFEFSAASEEEKDGWVKVLERIISSSMSQEDKKGEELIQ